MFLRRNLLRRESLTKGYDDYTDNYRELRVVFRAPKAAKKASEVLSEA
jgi:hypothetical protein